MSENYFIINIPFVYQAEYDIGRKKGIFSNIVDSFPVKIPFIGKEDLLMSFTNDDSPKNILSEKIESGRGIRNSDAFIYNNNGQNVISPNRMLFHLYSEDIFFTASLFEKNKSENDINESLSIKNFSPQNTKNTNYVTDWFYKRGLVPFVEKGRTENGLPEQVSNIKSDNREERMKQMREQVKEWCYSDRIMIPIQFIDFSEFGDIDNIILKLPISKKQYCEIFSVHFKGYSEEYANIEEMENCKIKNWNVNVWNPEKLIKQNNFPDNYYFSKYKNCFSYLHDCLDLINCSVEEIENWTQVKIALENLKTKDNIIEKIEWFSEKIKIFSENLSPNTLKKTKYRAAYKTINELIQEDVKKIKHQIEFMSKKEMSNSFTM